MYVPLCAANIDFHSNAHYKVRKIQKIEIGQNVNYFAETGSNEFITVECNVFLDFDVIPAVFEKLLKSRITILG